MQQMDESIAGLQSKTQLTHVRLCLRLLTLCEVTALSAKPELESRVRLPACLRGLPGGETDTTPL